MNSKPDYDGVEVTRSTVVYGIEMKD